MSLIRADLIEQARCLLRCIHEAPTTDRLWVRELVEERMNDVVADSETDVDPDADAFMVGLQALAQARL